LTSGIIKSVSGPLVTAGGLSDAGIGNMVYVGKPRLAGEVLSVKNDTATILVYDNPTGLGPGENVEMTGAPLSVELAPGMLGGVFDGLQRPLGRMEGGKCLPSENGGFPALSRERAWNFTAVASAGDRVSGGDVIGTVEESGSVLHSIMVPYGKSGVVESIQSGLYSVTDTVGILRLENGITEPLTMLQTWPVRERPCRRRISPNSPLCSGQRVIDGLFPIAKGGSAALCGPCGTGKTILLRQLAASLDADVVVYIACGGRSGGTAELLRELSLLQNPRTGETLMSRTVVIAGSAALPAVLEAAVLTGISIGEYFRDMGHHVTVIADSVSHWAEALRALSGRLGEPSGTGGYPAGLTFHLAQFFGRAGCVASGSGAGERIGSLTAVGALSLPDGSLSHPVAQAVTRLVGAFWVLDSTLAFERRFPAVQVCHSYSRYFSALTDWYTSHVEHEFPAYRERVFRFLREEERLSGTVRRLGRKSLSPEDRLTVEIACLLRETLFDQNAFAKPDSCEPSQRQLALLRLILEYDRLARAAVKKGADISELLELGLREHIGYAKHAAAEQNAGYSEELKRQIQAIAAKGGDGQ